jgi:hypothetical protein
MLDPRLEEHLGAQEFRALSTWCENKECRIRLEQWLGGGKSQAVLAVVLIQDRYSPRKGVLKYCPASRAGAATDFRDFQKALDSGPPGFADKHLIGIDQATDSPIPSGSGGLFLLMKYVGGGRDDYDTMATLLDRAILGSACETIVTSTLVEWNEVEHEDEQSNDDQSAVGFLHEIFGDSCEPGGSIHAAAKKLNVSCSEAFFHGSRKEPLPNPLATATSGKWIEEMSVLGLRGNSHGDLHADNILIPLPQQGNPSAADFERYRLIDLSTFRSGGLKAVDPAHLLLSIIARRLGDVSDTRKKDLARLVLEPERDPGGIPVELASAVHGIQQVGNSHFDEKGLYKEWRAEFTLAIAGCALLFVGRDLPDNHRQWFLELAGMAIDKFKNTQPQGDQLTQGQPAQERDEPPEKNRHAPTKVLATSPTILSNELDSFRSDLTDRLRTFQGKLALDIGHISLGRFADHLNTKLEICDAALADDGANAFSEAQRDTIMGLNSRIGALAGLVKELALLVEWCVKPTRPGELSASRSDLTELREGLSEVKGTIEGLVKTIEQARRILARQRGGRVDSGPRSEINRPYRREQIVAINEYRR